MDIGTSISSSSGPQGQVNDVGPPGPVNLTLPAIAGATIGQAATLSLGTWQGADSLTARLLRNGTEILSGITEGQQVTWAAADDGAQMVLSVTAQNAGGAAVAASAAVSVVYVAPTAAAGLMDEIFDLDTGPQPVDVSDDFTGDGLSYAVVGAGATIDPTSGIVMVPTDTAIAGQTVLVTAVNSGGSAQSAFTVTVEDMDEASAGDIIYDETFQDPTYQTQIDGTDIFVTLGSGGGDWSSDPDYTTDLIPGATAGALKIMGNDYTMQKLRLPMADPTLEHTLLCHAVWENQGGLLASGAFRIRFVDAAGDAMDPLIEVKFNTADTVLLLDTPVTMVPPEGAVAWEVAMYGRHRRGQLHIFDLMLTTPSAQPVAATGDVVDQTAPFGALTDAGTGGFKPLSDLDAEVDLISYDSLVAGSLGAQTPSISDGALVFSGQGAPDGAVLRCSHAGGTVDITVSEEAATYSFRADEWPDVMNKGVATLEGKTLKGRPGARSWNPFVMKDKSYTSTVWVESHHENARFQFITQDNTEWRNPQNVTFKWVDFIFIKQPGTGSTGVGALTLKGTIRGLNLIECDLDGGFTRSQELYGPAVTSSSYGWRGIFGMDGTSRIGTGWELGFYNCKIHDSWRAMNIPGGQGVLIVEGCEIYNHTVDFGVLSGARINGCKINWNVLRDPLIYDAIALQVVSVDVAANTMTVEDPLGILGDGRVINIHPDTGTMPGGVNLPGQGGANDYSCTVTPGTGDQKIVQFPVDITSAGADVFINIEPGHADMIQFVPGAGADVNNVEIIGNVVYGKPSADGNWPQNFFLEDIASTGTPGYYDDVTIAGNMIWGGDPKGIYLYNARRGLIAANTIVAPQSGVAANKTPEISLKTHWGYEGKHSLVTGNAVKVVNSDFEAADNKIERNITLLPSGYAASGIFAGTGGYSPETVDAFRAAFARTDLAGTIDYDARLYDLVEINDPGPITFADEVGHPTATLVTAAPVEITSILNSSGTAASVGALVSITGEGSFAFRITTDSAGTDVITDWTASAATIEVGQYLWVRAITAPLPATSREIVLFTGRQRSRWTLTTA